MSRCYQVVLICFSMHGCLVLDSFASAMTSTAFNLLSNDFCPDAATPFEELFDILTTKAHGAPDGVVRQFAAPRHAVDGGLGYAQARRQFVGGGEFNFFAAHLHSYIGTVVKQRLTAPESPRQFLLRGTKGSSRSN